MNRQVKLLSLPLFGMILIKQFNDLHFCGGKNASAGSLGLGGGILRFNQAPFNDFIIHSQIKVSVFGDVGQ
jgi:hypothetical protein